jgi:hypothetical protein
MRRLHAHAGNGNWLLVHGDFMLTNEILVFGLVAVLLGTAARFLGKRFFSSEAVAQRRLDRSNQRVISRRQGPTIKLASKVPRK